MTLIYAWGLVNLRRCPGGLLLEDWHATASTVKAHRVVPQQHPRPVPDPHQRLEAVLQGAPEAAVVGVAAPPVAPRVLGLP